MIKVRALEDGTYAGYLRIGAFEWDSGSFAGEVFEIDEKPFPLTDIDGNPIYETTENGKKVMDKDGKPKLKMGSWLAPWMEPVSNETPITRDLPKFEIPIQYRAKKVSVSNSPIPNPKVPNIMGSVI